MSAILNAFGIDWHLLVINTINFALLLGALWYFLYAPLTKMIEARREKVAEGVRAAHHAERHLAEIDASRTKILAEAGAQADVLIAEARKAGQEKERELVVSGEASAARIVEDAEAQAKELKEKAIQESKKEVAELIVLGVEKTLVEK
jgi:F-type H+-transporting ATPase subunit b